MRYNFGLQPSIYLSRSMGSSSPRNFGSEKFAKLNNCQFAASCRQFKQQFSDEQSRFVSPAKMKLAALSLQKYHKNTQNAWVTLSTLSTKPI